MTEDYRGHDLLDKVWELLEPHLSGRSGWSGRNAVDNRPRKIAKFNVNITIQFMNTDIKSRIHF